jgi:hypothetical protein
MKKLFVLAFVLFCVPTAVQAQYAKNYIYAGLTENDGGVYPQQAWSINYPGSYPDYSYYQCTTASDCSSGFSGPYTGYPPTINSSTSVGAYTLVNMTAHGQNTCDSGSSVSSTSSTAQVYVECGFAVTAWVSQTSAKTWDGSNVRIYGTQSTAEACDTATESTCIGVETQAICSSTSTYTDSWGYIC